MPLLPTSIEPLDIERKEQPPQPQQHSSNSHRSSPLTEASEHRQIQQQQQQQQQHSLSCQPSRTSTDAQSRTTSDTQTAGSASTLDFGGNTDPNHKQAPQSDALSLLPGHQHQLHLQHQQAPTATTTTTTTAVPEPSDKMDFGEWESSSDLDAGLLQFYDGSAADVDDGNNNSNTHNDGGASSTYQQQQPYVYRLRRHSLMASTTNSNSGGRHHNLSQNHHLGASNDGGNIASNDDGTRGHRTMDTPSPPSSDPSTNMGNAATTADEANDGGDEGGGEEAESQASDDEQQNATMMMSRSSRYNNSNSNNASATADAWDDTNAVSANATAAVADVNNGNLDHDMSSPLISALPTDNLLTMHSAASANGHSNNNNNGHMLIGNTNNANSSAHTAAATYMQQQLQAMHNANINNNSANNGTSAGGYLNATNYQQQQQQQQQVVQNRQTSPVPPMNSSMNVQQRQQMFQAAASNANAANTNAATTAWGQQPNTANATTAQSASAATSAAAQQQVVNLNVNNMNAQLLAIQQMIQSGTAPNASAAAAAVAATAAKQQQSNATTAQHQQQLAMNWNIQQQAYQQQQQQQQNHTINSGHTTPTNTNNIANTVAASSGTAPIQQQQQQQPATISTSNTTTNNSTTMNNNNQNNLSAQSSSTDLQFKSTSNKKPPFYLFDAPIELRANFQQNQRRLGIPVPEDCNSYHYGQTVKGFHPQQLLALNNANNNNATTVAAAANNNNNPIQLIDARHGPKKGVGRVRNEREQKRAQKITELIENIRMIMVNNGCEVENRSKFHTLSKCAGYIKNMLEANKEKEDTNSKLQNELAIKQRKLDEEKAAESRSDPESVESATSSLTTDSQSNKGEQEDGEAGNDENNGSNNMNSQQGLRKEDGAAKRKVVEQGAEANKDAPVNKKRRSEQTSSEESSGGDDRSGSKGPIARSITMDKTAISVSDLTDSNRDSSGNSGSGSGSSDRKEDGQISTQNSSPTDVDGDDSEDRRNAGSSISSDAAVKSGLDSRDHTGSGHKDVVFSKQTKKSRHGRKRPPEEVTSRERVFVLDYEEVFENSNIPQLIAATSGKAVSWNDTFLRMTGLRNEEVERMTIFSLVKPENLSNFFEIVAAALRKNTESSMQPGNVTPSDVGTGSSGGERTDSMMSVDDRTSSGTDTLVASPTNSNGFRSSANQNSQENSDGGTSSESCRRWNYRAMTLPCIEFPAFKKRRKADTSIQVGSEEQLYVTVTLLDDENPNKRCFHCVFTDCPGTNGALGSLTPELLEVLFSSPPKPARRGKHHRHHGHHRHHKSRSKHSRKSSRQMASKVPSSSGKAPQSDAHLTGDSHSTPSSGDTLTDKVPTSSQSGNSSGQDGSNSTLLVGKPRDSGGGAAENSHQQSAGEACQALIAARQNSSGTHNAHMISESKESAAPMKTD